MIRNLYDFIVTKPLEPLVAAYVGVVTAYALVPQNVEAVRNVLNLLCLALLVYLLVIIFDQAVDEL